MPPWKSVGLELVPTTLVPYILIFFGKQTLLQAALGALKTLAPEAAEISFFSASAHVLATFFPAGCAWGRNWTWAWSCFWASRGLSNHQCPWVSIATSFHFSRQFLGQSMSHLLRLCLGKNLNLEFLLSQQRPVDANLSVCRSCSVALPVLWTFYLAGCAWGKAWATCWIRGGSALYIIPGFSFLVAHGS